jgi:hypothetical protein
MEQHLKDQELNSTLNGIMKTSIRFIHNSVFIILIAFSFFVDKGHAQALSSISVVPANGAAGASNIHTITFTTSTALPADGRIVVVYPSDFVTTGVSIVSSSTMDGLFSVSGSGGTVTITRSGGTAQGGGQTETIQLANVVNATHASGYTASVATQDNGGGPLDSGLSSGFTIMPSGLDHFKVSGIGASITAGGPFTVNIEALDSHENRVTSFSLTADLSDQTGSLSPKQTTSFTSGYWTGSLFSITKTTTSNNITVVSQGKSGTSSYFRVDPTVLKGFDFDPILSPQTAGTGFSVGITAKDTLGNIKTNFTGTITLSEKTATLEVQATGTNTTPAFVSGRWSGNVSIEAANQDVQITATGSGKSGISGYFNVNPAALDHFGIVSISDQSAGMPFLITIFALDAHENIATQFTGTGHWVNIGHSGAGSIIPAQSGNFINGIWTGTVSIAQTQSGDRISVNDGSGHSVTSNLFNVLSSPVDHFEFSSIGPSQTAGLAFTVTIRAVDASENTVTTFNGTSNVKDETGSIAPIQITFAAGQWSGTFVITKSALNDFLTVTGVGRSGTSNTFQMQPGTVSSFEISSITSPKTSGVGFPVTFTAKDGFGNTATGFNGTVTLDGGSVVVTPATSGAFSGGVRTETLNIARAQNDIQVTIRDGSAHIGISNRFNLIPGVLHHFAIGTVADQAAGMPFSLSVTAQDASNNTVSGFYGPGSTVAISHTGSGAVSPTVSGNFTNGLWIGNISIAQTQASDQIVVIRSGGSQTGSSNAFAVTPSNVDHFVFSSISDPQTAGSEFGITIRAVDGSGNTVTSFAGSCSLIDETGTGTPSTIHFTAGQWTGNETVTRSSFGNSLTVTGGGKSGTSNSFDVRPASVQSFEIGLIGSPKNAGIGFAITITAKDMFGNTASGFGGTVSISDAAGPLIPANSGAFSNGVRNETVQITHSGQDVFLSVSDGAGHTGGSNFFNVLPGPVDHFEITTIGSQVAKVPFTIIITAMDRFNSPATGFNGTVDMGDLSGTINPIRSGSFISGHWSGGVTIDQAVVTDRIRVARTGGFESGTSNDFAVNAPPGVQVVDFSASVHEVTAGQNQNWSLSLVVKNLASSDAQFDSLKVRFWLAGEQHDYQLILPTLFRHSGTATLGGNQQDTLFILVDRTGSSSGDVTMEATPYFTDGGTGLVVFDQGHAGIAVRDSARLRIDQIRLSQNEVTEGQDQDWTASVYITNIGGSEVVIDSSRAKTYLTFSLGAGWKYLKPQTLGKGTWRLAGGDQDSLTFIVEKTGSGDVDFCDIHANVSAVEINTNRQLSTNTQGGGSARLKIESPPDLRIVSMENMAVNRPYLDVNQTFTIRVSIENSGGDGLHNVQVILDSDGYSIFLDANSKTIETLPGGIHGMMEFDIQASQMPNASEVFTVRVSGYIDNTGDLTAEKEETTAVVLQNPAELLVQTVTPSVQNLTGGQKDPWLVKVLVRNAGDAVLILEPPKADDLSFWNSDIYQVDYAVRPPVGLKHGGFLTLAGGAMDTLIYTVGTTGSLGGTVDVRARISGKDKNNPLIPMQTSEGNATVFVKSDPSFRIISTQIEAVHTTSAADGIVNVGQEYRVLVILENGIGQTINNIKIQIGTDGGSEIMDEAVVLIPSLKPTSPRDTVYYQVTADTKENASEIFSSKITQAFFENTGQPVPVGASLDSTAKVTIQSPTRIALQLTMDNPQGMVSTQQKFVVSAELQNRGTSDLAGMAVVQLILPEGFSLAQESPSDTLRIGLKNPVEWTVEAPSEANAGAWVSATLLSDRIPDDRNTGEPAKVDELSSGVFVTTVASKLSVRLSIDSPEGAKDGILSTGQKFVLKATVPHRYVRDIIAQIVLPNVYKTADRTEKSVQDSVVVWQIDAPADAASEAFIQVQARGVDSLQQEIIVTGITGSITVSTVWRAELSLGLTITKPPDVAQNKTVSLGQEFEITARIQKSGEADTSGIARVSLEPLTGGYTTSEPLTKTIGNGIAIWTIKAPMLQTAEAVSIKARLTTAPLDENTNAEAMVIQPNDAVAVTMTGTWLAIMPSFLPGWVPSTVTQGQDWVRLMILEATNRGADGSSSIQVESMKFVLEDRFNNLIPPYQALSEISVTDALDSTLVFGRSADLGENPATISFSKNCVIPVGGSKSIAIFGRIADDPQTDFFQINIPSGDYINARDPNSHNSVSVKDATGEDWMETGMRSDPKKIFKPETESVLWNSPNPFSPAKGPTRILYYLDKNTDVRFSLYTLVGELVWTVSFNEPDPNATSGMHTLLWEGLNGQAQQVMNGVYFLFMKTADGKIVKTKIAVVK